MDPAALFPDAAAWRGIFIPSVPLLETVVRGTVMYLGLFAVMRLARRESSGFSLADILLITLLGDAAQNAMIGSSTTLTDGVLLIATIVGWERAIDWLSWRFTVVRTWLLPAPLPLIANGRIIRANLRREWITVDELLAQLRRSEVEGPSGVARCTLEADGSITVIKSQDG